MISSISSSYASQLAQTLFAKLDTDNQGFFEKLDLETALAGVSSLSDTEDTLSVDDVFSQLDSNSDGKVTEDELTSSLQQLADELNSQYDAMRMGGMGGMSGMPPPPPPSDSEDSGDQGYTLEELQAQLDEIGSSDSQRSALISEIVDNFASADANSDGKVTFAEAMAYDQSVNGSASATAATTSTATSDTSSASSGGLDARDLGLVRMVMELMRAYGSDAYAATTAGFSASA